MICWAQLWKLNLHLIYEHGDIPQNMQGDPNYGIWNITIWGFISLESKILLHLWMYIINLSYKGDENY